MKLPSIPPAVPPMKRPFSSSYCQFNTTIFGLDHRYRGINGGRRVIFMNRDGIAEAGVQDRQLVDLI